MGEESHDEYLFDVTARDPGRYESDYESGQLYEDATRFFDAQAFERALAVYLQSWSVDRHSKTAERIGLCYTTMGKFDDAMKWHDMAIAENPRRQGAYRTRAELFERLGDYDAAIRDYEMALSITPHFKLCRDAITRLQALLDRRTRDRASGQE